MKNNFGLIFILVSILCPFFASAQWNTRPQNRIIYGKDDRTDIYQITHPAVTEATQSVALLVDRSQIRTSVLGAPRGAWTLETGNYGQRQKLCPTERFFKQPSSGFCSGFLVGPDLLATAGHCIKASECPKVVFVFGFRMQNENAAVTSFSEPDIYTCKKVIAQEYTMKQDYALVQLDRPVVGRKPLTLANRAPTVSEAIYVVGHPSGLPMKVAASANIRKLSPEFFTANTDSYGGNSGSPIFSAQTNEVLGILVRGEKDFESSPAGCMVSKVCDEAQCRGEDVTYIQYITKLLGRSGQVRR